jgi:putative Ca2+/H+ antiporter (TMEM165/GDT1 family)
VVAGTTLGMLLVDAPTAFLGDVAAKRIPFRAVRIVAATLFAGLGAWVLAAPRFAS